MPSRVLGQLGYIDASSARLWVASSEPATVRCQIAIGALSLTPALTLQEPTCAGVVHLENLVPGNALSYQWQNVDGGGWKDASGPGTSGTIRLPGTNDPDKFAIALTSCNNVLPDYPPVTRDPQERWQALKELIDREEIDLLVHAGDQVYMDPLLADYMTDTAGYETDARRLRKAIAEWPEQVRNRYIRHFSSSTPGGIQDVLAARPSVMIWDDHELYDGWGSQLHPSLTGWKAWEEIVTRAFRDFQASHNPDPIPGAGFGFGFRRGSIGFLALDLRTFRGQDSANPLLGPTQLEAVRSWWSGQKRPCKLLLVLSSTPIGHLWGQAWQDLYRYLALPQWQLDLKDLWSSPVNGNITDLGRFLDFLTYEVIEGGKRKVLILSGDVHMSHGATIRHSGTGSLIHEFICSAISNEIPSLAIPTILGALERQHATPPRMGEYELLLDPPFITQRNFGQVMIDTRTAQARVSCLVHASQEPSPVLVKGF
jgi:phosphodiesterase/alkaline phosphatase D-like protein